MSTRGINFLHRWLANNVPKSTKADVISVDELTHKLVADAKALGIKRIVAYRRPRDIRHEGDRDIGEKRQCEPLQHRHLAGVTGKDF